jgi:hypothetical protein
MGNNCEAYLSLDPFVTEIFIMTSLEQLKNLTKVVADTGDFAAMEKFKPQVKQILNKSIIK